MSKAKEKDTLTEYHEDIPDIVSRFSFDHPAAIDESGLIDLPEGFARPFYHKPTNTVGLFFSKNSKNLQGRTAGNGKIYAEQGPLSRCYIIGARRSKGDVDSDFNKRPSYHSNRRTLRDDLDAFCKEMRARNLKHFTLFGAESADVHPALLHLPSIGKEKPQKNDVFTNGRLAYLLQRDKKDRYEVIFLAPTRRKDGSFVPVDLSEKWSLRRTFSKVSRKVAMSNSYEGARYALMQHWGEVSSRLWDEKNLYDHESTAFRAKKLAADFVNVSQDHMATFAGATLMIGGAMSIYNPQLGLLGGISGALAHAVAHIAIEKTIEGSYQAREKAHEARQKFNIEAYGYHSDVADHFKIQTAENIAKLCPHVDQQRFDAEEFEFLTDRQFSLLRDREEAMKENPRVGSLSRHLLFMHQRGFSSTCTFLDRRTRLDMFQSGIVRFMHEKKGGNILVFAQYRPDLCMAENLRLPEYYIDQFEGGMVRLEYDRRQKDLTRALVGKREAVSQADAIREIERDCLFSTQPDVPWFAREKSLQAVYSAFPDPSLRSYAHRNIRRNPVRLADMRSMSV